MNNQSDFRDSSVVTEEHRQANQDQSESDSFDDESEQQEEEDRHETDNKLQAIIMKLKKNAVENQEIAVSYIYQLNQ